MHFRGNEGAGAIRTPVFMAHGANDPRLSLAETKRMIEALERHGLPV
jgi:dipeptidyl aminopeptidase/acylaminoacyl peptidase